MGKFIFRLMGRLGDFMCLNILYLLTSLPVVTAGASVSALYDVLYDISRGKEGLEEFKPSNILEIDRLYDVVVDLTERQRKAENILLEEKERYKLALESSKDIFSPTTCKARCWTS